MREAISEIECETKQNAGFSDRPRSPPTARSSGPYSEQSPVYDALFNFNNTKSLLHHYWHSRRYEPWLRFLLAVLADRTSQGQLTRFAVEKPPLAELDAWALHYQVFAWKGF